MNKKYKFDYFTPPGYVLVDSSLRNPLDDEIFDDFGNYKMTNNFDCDELNSAILKEEVLICDLKKY